MAENEKPLRNHAHADLLTHAHETDHGRTGIPPSDAALRLGLICLLQDEALELGSDSKAPSSPSFEIVKMWKDTGLAGQQRMVDTLAELLEEFAEAPATWTKRFGSYAVGQLFLTTFNIRQPGAQELADGFGDDLSEIDITDHQRKQLTDAVLSIVDPRKWGHEKPTVEQRINGLNLLDVLGATQTKEFYLRVTNRDAKMTGALLHCLSRLGIAEFTDWVKESGLPRDEAVRVALSMSVLEMKILNEPKLVDRKLRECVNYMRVNEVPGFEQLERALDNFDKGAQRLRDSLELDITQPPDN